MSSRDRWMVLAAAVIAGLIGGALSNMACKAPPEAVAQPPAQQAQTPQAPSPEGEPPPVVRAQSFELVDPYGNVLARLAYNKRHLAVLTFIRHDRKVGLTLDCAGLLIRDDELQEGNHVTLNSNRLTFWHNREQRFYAGVSEGRPEIGMYAKKFQPRFSAFVDAQGSPHIELKDRHSKVTWKVPE